jgi:hypothetical protein
MKTRDESGFDRIDFPEVSRLRCPCGSAFEWSGWDDRRAVWVAQHAPHLTSTPETSDEENDEATIRHAMQRPVEPVLRAQFKTIRRLRALIKAAEHQGRGDPDDWAFSCPWCPATSEEQHTADCPAFTPEGGVR